MRQNRDGNNKVVIAALLGALALSGGWLWERRIMRKVARFVDAKLAMRHEAHR